MPSRPSVSSGHGKTRRSPNVSRGWCWTNRARKVHLGFVSASCATCSTPSHGGSSHSLSGGWSRSNLINYFLLIYFLFYWKISIFSILNMHFLTFDRTTNCLSHWTWIFRLTWRWLTGKCRRWTLRCLWSCTSTSPSEIVTSAEKALPGSVHQAKN